MTDCSATEERPLGAEPQEVLSAYRATYDHLLVMETFAGSSARWIDRRTGRPIGVVHVERLYDVLEPVIEWVREDRRRRATPIFESLDKALGGLARAAIRSREEFLQSAHRGASITSCSERDMDAFEHALEIAEEPAPVPPVPPESTVVGDSTHNAVAPLDSIGTPPPVVHEPIVGQEGLATASEATGSGADAGTNNPILATWQRDGDYWMVGWGDRIERLRPRAGFDTIAKILNRPRPYIAIGALEIVAPHALELEAVVQTRQQIEEIPDTNLIRMQIDELMDKRAQAQENLELDREEDFDQQIKKRERYLSDAALAETKGDFGNQHPSAKAANRVTQQLTRAYKLVGVKHPELAAHLRECIRRDSCSFSYQPGGNPPRWLL